MSATFSPGAQPMPANTVSASGLLSMLTEPSAPLRKAALRKLLVIVDTHWHEVAQSLPDLEALAEDTEETPETRQIAAAVASHVFFHLEEPGQALRLALESGNDVFNMKGSYNKAYVDCLVSAAIDAYVTKKKADSVGEEVQDEHTGSLDMAKLQQVLQYMFQQCFEGGNFHYALGIALEAMETSKVQEVLTECAVRSNETTLYQLLKHSLTASTNLVISKKFRNEVVESIAQQTQILMESSSSVILKKEAAVTLSQCYQILKQAVPVANIISSLLDGSEEEYLLAYQLCFDLIESGDQSYVNQVEQNLPKKGGDNEKSEEVWTRYNNAVRILTGGLSSELALSFMHKFSDSDPLIMQNLKKALEERGSARNSLLHNCAVMTHSYLNAGTTNDAFLRDNLDWMKKASNW